MRHTLDEKIGSFSVNFLYSTDKSVPKIDLGVAITRLVGVDVETLIGNGGDGVRNSKKLSNIYNTLIIMLPNGLHEAFANSEKLVRGENECMFAYTLNRLIPSLSNGVETSSI